MNDFLNWEDELYQNAKTYTAALINEARTLPSPKKGIDMLKGLKQGFPEGYHGTTQEAIINVLNNVIDDAIKEIYKQGLERKWSDADGRK